jgi:DNA-binding GntR family transcriptional regulator
VAARGGGPAGRGAATAAPLLWIERVAIDMLERPVELRLSWMATDRLRYAITLE